jgi:hypothetical protein
VPADARAGRVFAGQHLFETLGRKACHGSRPRPPRKERVGYWLGLLEAAAVEIVAPSEGGSAALPGKPLKLEGRQIEPLDLTNDLLLLGTRQGVGAIATPLGNEGGATLSSRSSWRDKVFTQPIWHRLR